jgi:4-amino-4-deoxy-L-arabinose transferase-like glycosyltransferase
MFKVFKNPLFWLAIIVVIAFIVRLYKIDNPIADWHSWRQADTAAVARNFYKEGWNPFIPKYDDMSAVSEVPLPNKQRYRMVEFPTYNSLVYFAYLLNGGVDEKLARLVSIIFSLGSTVFVFLISKKYFGVICALLSAFLYAILPFNVFFSRVILPEPSLVFFCLGMFYFTDRWIKENTTQLFLISAAFTSLAFLTKPMAIFYLLPLIYSFYHKEKKWWPIPKRYFYFLFLSLIPFFGWRIWISQFPEGIPASNWLFNGNSIRFRPAFWKWIVGDRFGREILGVTGTFLFLIGLLKKPEVGGFLLHILALSMLFYLVVFATGNVQHDYYQYLIIPALVIFMARGFLLLLKGIEGFIPRIWTIPLGFLFLILTIYLTWNEVKGLYQINNPAIVEAGKVADQILPKDAYVIASYNGDASFLYQTNRAGLANIPLPIKDLIDSYNIDYFISTAKDAKTSFVMQKYTILVDTPTYVIIDLTKENPDFDVSQIEPI